MADANQQDLVHTSNEMKSDIVCPLSLKIAIASEGRLGAIQSYRCAPRPNSGGWETRPQPKTDKWTADFFRVLHGPKGQPVTLSDGQTTVNGLGLDESTKSFHFRHEDGVRAKELAIQFVKSGKLRATRNWDKVFAPEAGMTKEQLESTYPDLYKTSTRSSGSTPRSNGGDAKEIQALGEGFFDEEESMSSTEGEAAVEAEPLDESDQELIDVEEASYEQEEEEPSYSVMAELDLEEETSGPATATMPKTDDNTKQVAIKTPPSGAMMKIHSGCEGLDIDVGDGEFITFYRVRDPETGKSVFLREGWNKDYSNYFLELT